MWTTVISAVIAENLARNSNEYQHLEYIYIMMTINPKI